MTFRSLPPSSIQIVSAGLVIFSLLSGAHPLNVDTPNDVSECETTRLTWEGDHAPFILNIQFNQNGSLFKSFANLSGNAMNWRAAVPAGSTLHLELLDSSDKGPSAFSGPFTILSGSDSCLNSSATSSSASTGTHIPLLSRHHIDVSVQRLPPPRTIQTQERLLVGRRVSI